jgi:hypothetical protein
MSTVDGKASQTKVYQLYGDFDIALALSVSPILQRQINSFEMQRKTTAKSVERSFSVTWPQLKL